MAIVYFYDWHNTGCMPHSMYRKTIYCFFPSLLGHGPIMCMESPRNIIVESNPVASFRISSTFYHQEVLSGKGVNKALELLRTQFRKMTFRVASSMSTLFFGGSTQY